MSARHDAAVGPWTRLGIALRVGLALLLVALCAALSTWLAERPGLRARADLTHSGRNTLDPVLADLVSKLPERATIEVFFQPVPKLIAGPGREAQGRMTDLLRVLQNAAPEKIKVIDHPPDDVTGARAALSALRMDGDQFGLVVVHRDEIRVPLRLLVDIAQIDLGNPDPNHFVPPRLVSFRGEEEIAGALKRVVSSERPKLLFSTGHGERNLYAASSDSGNETRDLGALESALVADGFSTERYEGKGEPIPAECAVLAIVDPVQAFSQAEMSAIESYVKNGGRLLVTGSHRYPAGSGSTAELAARFGIGIGMGYVCEPIAGPSGEVYGQSGCANVFVGSEGLSIQHPVSESLARFGVRVWSPMTRPLTRTPPPAGAVLAEVARSSARAWVDLPLDGNQYDWHPDPQNEKTNTRFAVASVVEITPEVAAGADSELVRGRVLVLGSPEFLSTAAMEANKDFALNAFNWLAAREYRLSVATKAEQRNLLEVRQGDNLVKLRSLVLFGLPGLCALLGLLTWYQRRR